MVEQVEINEAETTAEKPEEQVQENKVDGLPEKFKSVEDLAKSYSELEKKLGEPKVEETPEPQAEETKQETDLEIANKAAESAGLNMDNLQSEFDENGALGEKSYEALEKAGIPKQYVDQFIAGQQAVVARTSNEIKELVGGDEGYNEMVSWAETNLSDAEKTAYNNAVNGSDLESIKLAVNGLKARYQGANGVEPTLVKGKASASSGAGYRSWAEVTEAMNDPRYAKDPAYQADVKTKLSNSNL